MLEVLYEDNHIIAVNKKSSDLVQGDITGDSTLADQVKEYIKKKYNKPGNVYLGTTHRLDRPVSGVVLFAKTSKALTRLNKMFQDKTINKTYWAIVLNQPPKEEDELVNYLIKNAQKNKSVAFKKEEKNSKKATLSYKLISQARDHFLLEVYPKTGRHHQIRVQLSKIGCTIKGDTKYGADRPNKDRSICLHARRISFIHPTQNEPIEISAPVPDSPYWASYADL